MQSSTAEPLADQDQRTASRFISAFALFLLTGVAIVVGAFWLLHRARALPPPPLTGTSCIDEKLAFLRSADLHGVDLLAVGSSTTWRNLDLSLFERSGLARKPINAAPCYLYLNQTAYLTEELLRQMPEVRTVMTVIAARDFELCAPHETAFIGRDQLERYVFEGREGWHYYLTNIRLKDFTLDALRFRAWRTDPLSKSPMAMDVYGSSPVQVQTGWQPVLTIDERCFAGLERLQAVTTRKGVRLLVAMLPVMPAWQQSYDPDGKIMAELEDRVRRMLREPLTMFLAGGEYRAADRQFADPVHLLGSETTAFTNYIATTLLAARHQRTSSR